MSAVSWPKSRLGRLVAKLEKHHGVPGLPPASGAFELVLWEIAAYLKDDDSRARAFTTLQRLVGLEPAKVAAASVRELTDIARLGGILAEERAGRWLRSAEIVLRQFGGNLDTALHLPLPQARKALMKFPMIGEPGAEKILLLTGAAPVLALDSNGVRVLTRLGYGNECKNYAATYRAVQQSAAADLPADCATLTRAHLLLRDHGRTLCLRNRPACGSCPVRSDCPSAAE